MDELFNKELEKIQSPIAKFIESALLDGFKNRKQQPITKVDRIPFINIEVDAENSEIKEKIIVTRVTAQADVWVSYYQENSTNNTLNLSINKGLIINYDNETKEYKIDNADGVFLIDKTMY